MGNAITERTISNIQILEVRVQCVVVDMHIDQPLQNKNNSMPNQAKSFCPIIVLQTYCKQSKGFGQRDKFIVPILICWKDTDLRYAILCLSRSLRGFTRTRSFRD